jgi:hypothetical protein
MHPHLDDPAPKGDGAPLVKIPASSYGLFDPGASFANREAASHSEVPDFHNVAGQLPAREGVRRLNVSFRRVRTWLARAAPLMVPDFQFYNSTNSISIDLTRFSLVSPGQTLASSNLNNAMFWPVFP